MTPRRWILVLMILSLAGLFFARGSVPPTVAHDSSLAFVELEGYRFHVHTEGDPSRPPVVVVHGGPGGDSTYLRSLRGLAKDHFVVWYDQRGTGLSPRVAKETLTLERNLEDLDLVVRHYGGNGPVKLIGHSWGGMLTVGYLGRHPERVSHAVVVEPGILNAKSAEEFVRRLKASQSIRDGLTLLRFIARGLLVSSVDGHERFDYVMTRMLNQTKPGGPYQCAGESMPADSFTRAGFAAFANTLKPVLDHPERFTDDLTQGTAAYRGKLLMLSSECSFIGYDYQQRLHLPLLPPQTIHLEAKRMGHNMLTLNFAWSIGILQEFFAGESR